MAKKSLRMDTIAVVPRRKGRYYGGGLMEPVGVVHGQEYVVDANTTRALGGPEGTEKALAKQLERRGALGFQAGGSPSQYEPYFKRAVQRTAAAAAGRDPVARTQANVAFGRLAGQQGAARTQLRAGLGQVGASPAAVGSAMAARTAEEGIERSQLGGQLALGTQQRAYQATRDLGTLADVGQKFEESKRRTAVSEGERALEQMLDAGDFSGYQRGFKELYGKDIDIRDAQTKYYEKRGQERINAAWETGDLNVVANEYMATYGYRPDMKWLKDQRDAKRAEWARGEEKWNIDKQNNEIQALLSMGSIDEVATRWKEIYGYSPDTNWLKDEQAYVRRTRTWEGEDRNLAEYERMLGQGAYEQAGNIYEDVFGMRPDMSQLVADREHLVEKRRWEGQDQKRSVYYDLLKVNSFDEAADVYFSAFGVVPDMGQMKMDQSFANEKTRIGIRSAKYGLRNSEEGRIAGLIADGADMEAVKAEINSYLSDYYGREPTALEVEREYGFLYSHAFGREFRSSQFAVKWDQYESMIESGSDAGTLRTAWEALKEDYPEYVLTEPDWEAITRNPAFDQEYRAANANIISEMVQRGPNALTDDNGDPVALGADDPIRYFLNEKYRLMHGTDAPEDFITTEFNNTVKSYTQSNVNEAVDYIKDQFAEKFDTSQELEIATDWIKRLMLSRGIVVDEAGNVTVNTDNVQFAWDDPKHAHEFMRTPTGWEGDWDQEKYDARERYVNTTDEPMGLGKWEDWYDAILASAPPNRAGEYIEKGFEQLTEAGGKWEDVAETFAGMEVPEGWDIPNQEIWNNLGRPQTTSEYISRYKEAYVGDPTKGTLYRPAQKFDESRADVEFAPEIAADGRIKMGDQNWHSFSNGQWIRFDEEKTNWQNVRVPPGAYVVVATKLSNDQSKSQKWLVNESGDVYPIQMDRGTGIRPASRIRSGEIAAPEGEFATTPYDYESGEFYYRGMKFVAKNPVKVTAEYETTGPESVVIDGRTIKLASATPGLIGE